ncbi:MAG: NAD-binding protein [Smithellaceae bacterium]|nr:potassium channel protein [Syntrophaceae bacterium]NMD04976.1 potassium channel protein [Deltaproteobacteria bacterium]
MKYLPSIFTTVFSGKMGKQNVRLLLRYIFVLALLISFYSIIFHYLMAAEGQKHSWITGFYWVLVVMSTLGFGDITFTSDVGRLFSIIVLASGVIFLLILLPFIFIKFFFAPWMDAQAKSRAPRELPPDTAGHVIITNYDAVTTSLIEKLTSYKQNYVVIVDNLHRTLELYDLGVYVALGSIDDPQTYKRLQVQNAALVVATNSDQVNTNVTFTVREMSERVPIFVTADSPHSVDILTMAGSSHVLLLYDMIGKSLASLTIAGDCKSNVIGRYEDLIIAQAPVIGTPLEGKTIMESDLRKLYGLSVVGIWERGKFTLPRPDTIIDRTSVLVFAGSAKALDAYDEVYSFYHICKIAGDPVIIIGGGRVGLAAAARFCEREIPYLIIEKNPKKARPGDNYVFGDAADINTLEKAWFEKAPAALITPHDDATNIYLTKYLRSLRPDMQILSRASADRNVSTLHRAGADFVISNASLGANIIFNFLRNEDTLLLTEGLNIFHLKAPDSLVGKVLLESGIRERTGCTVIAISRDGKMSINPEAKTVIKEDDELVLIGTFDAEKSFLREIKT